MRTPNRLGSGSSFQGRSPKRSFFLSGAFGHPVHEKAHGCRPWVAVKALIAWPYKGSTVQLFLNSNRCERLLALGAGGRLRFRTPGRSSLFTGHAAGPVACALRDGADGVSVRTREDDSWWDSRPRCTNRPRHPGTSRGHTASMPSDSCTPRTRPWGYPGPSGSRSAGRRAMRARESTEPTPSGSAAGRA